MTKGKDFLRCNVDDVARFELDGWKKAAVKSKPISKKK